MLLLLEQDSTQFEDISNTIGSIENTSQEVIVRFLSNLLDYHILHSVFLVCVIHEFAVWACLPLVEVADDHLVNVLQFGILHLEFMSEYFDCSLSK